MKFPSNGIKKVREIEARALVDHFGWPRYRKEIFWQEMLPQ